MSSVFYVKLQSGGDLFVNHITTDIYLNDMYIWAEIIAAQTTPYVSHQTIKSNQNIAILIHNMVNSIQKYIHGNGGVEASACCSPTHLSVISINNDNVLHTDYIAWKEKRTQIQTIRKAIYTSFIASNFYHCPKVCF